MAPRRSLLPLFSAAVDRLIQAGIEQPYGGKNTWVTGREGEIYIRYVPEWRRAHPIEKNWIHPSQLDLATFSILPAYRRKGVSACLIGCAMTKPITVVKIENIVNPEWGKKLALLSFSGRKTTMIHGDGRRSMTLLFTKEST